jgi:uncharacterized protein
VSWIHEQDFVRAVMFLADPARDGSPDGDGNGALDAFAGPVNLAAPRPLPQREFMRSLRAAWGIPVGLPATRWMAELGAFALRSDTELLLKSRRVTPGRLLDAGFAFDHPEWPGAAADLAHHARAARAGRP